MKTSIALLILGLVVANSNFVNASPKRSAKHATKRVAAKQKGAAKTKAVGGDLKTDLSFDDSVLHGEYQTPDEALAKVENEKGFGDLVGVRKHFKDRLGQASEQE